jgi:acetyl-CoA acetyltransferase
MSGQAGIAGAWETSDRFAIPDTALAELHVEAAVRAIAESGMASSEVDGIACSTMPPGAIAALLGIHPGWIDATVQHGCSSLVQVRRAARAIADGQVRAVLVVHAESIRSQVGVQWPWPPTDPASLAGQFEAPYGVGPQGMFAMYLARYLHVHGLTVRDVAAIPVAQRRWAAGNPAAAYRDPISEDDVLSSPVIAWPLHRLMCAATTDNAGAFVVTSSDLAADLVPQPVLVLGSGEGYDSDLVSQASSPLAPRPLRDAATAALAEADLDAAELNHLMLYDGFAHSVLFALDALGLCEQGGGAEFVRQHASPGGRWPINTNGGYLSYRHGDMAQVHEAIRQLRGSAFRQVDGVRRSLVLGAGPTYSSAGALVLSAA